MVVNVTAATSQYKTGIGPIMSCLLAALFFAFVLSDFITEKYFQICETDAYVVT